jgi:YggT family protein
MAFNLEPTDRREEIRVHQQPDFEQREQIVVDAVAERRQLLYRVSQLIWLAAGVLEAMIGLRVFLKLIAANPNAFFARFVYAMTAPFLWPFSNLTVTPSAEGMVLEISSLIAMVVYAVATWVVVQAIWLLFFRTYTRSLKTYRRTN